MPTSCRSELNIQISCACRSTDRSTIERLSSLCLFWPAEQSIARELCSLMLGNPNGHIFVIVGQPLGRSTSWFGLSFDPND